MVTLVLVNRGMCADDLLAVGERRNGIIGEENEKNGVKVLVHSDFSTLYAMSSYDRTN